MSRGRGQPPDLLHHLLLCNGASFLNRLPRSHFCNQRPARHRRHTSLGSKSDFPNATANYSNRQLENIATRWVLDPHPRIRVGEVPRVARVFEVVQKLSRIHSCFAEYRIHSGATKPPRIINPLMPSPFTPQRVVCLQPSATLTMRDLGLLDRVVACTKYCADVCPEASDGSRLIVSDSWTAQAAQILAAKPDLVLASVPYQLEAVSEILKAGTRFMALAPRTLADIYTDIVAIAGILGVLEQGEQVVANMRATIEDVRARCITTGDKPRVFCEEWGKPIIASQPWVAELIEIAGGTFVGQPGKTLPAEDIAQLQPEVLLAAWCGAGDRVPLEKIVEQRHWSGLPAVRAHRVFCINDELLNTPATSLIGGLRAIAWALHPDQFPKPAGIRQIVDL